MLPRWLWALILVGLTGAYFGWSHRPVRHTPGELVAAEPVQRSLSGAPPQFHKFDSEIVGRARFSIEARVLGAERYRLDRMAKLVPVDLALGWGPMSDSAVLAELSISQANRYYFWSTPALPIPRHDIETHSANMHLIPANDAIERRILAARVGQIVRFSGYLVDVKGDGWQLRSSMTRDDTGAGACEVIWVEDFE